MKKISIKEIFRKSWEDFKANWKPMMLVGILMTLLAAVSNFELDSSGYISSSELILLILSGILSVFLSLGFVRMILSMIRGKEIVFSDVFKNISGKLFLSFLIVGILTGVILGLGFLIFIIPGLFLMTALYPAQYLVADEQSGPIDAIKRSWFMTKGHRWKIFGFMILLVILSLLAIIPIIGTLIIVPLVTIASVRLYVVLSESGDSEDENLEIIVEEKKVVMESELKENA